MARRRSSLSTFPRSMNQKSWIPAACDCAFFLYRLLSFVQCNVNGISPMDEDNPAGAHLAGLFTEPFVTLNL